MAGKTVFDNSSAEPFAKGLVQVFTGDGRGKTTAALGTVIRALGHGLKVCIIYFIKGDSPSGERSILSQLPNVTVLSYGSGEFIDPANVKPKEKEQAEQALTAAREAMLGGNYNIVVLDEVNLAAAWKLIEVDEIIRLIKDKPQNVELILTGRQADTKIVQNADLVTEMLKIKHSYDKGISARMGIEY
ncbi:MAG: cob(I)yrinic acid a,c-diamide adenosyltransferase [Dehalococcoidales bacterium]|nr:cob(I)yrinic acid a,c-diamide adenosyltransferase [Dehalococcoidales bacterium]